MRNKPNFKINMPEINAYILIIGIMSRSEERRVGKECRL